MKGHGLTGALDQRILDRQILDRQIPDRRIEDEGSSPEGNLVLANDLRSDTESAATAGLYVELWVSLASLLRSYTAAHGLNGNRQATVELGEEKILVRQGELWLELTRSGARVAWQREDGRQGKLEFTLHGRLRQPGAEEEEMDMAAERWARELIHNEL
jgi:hypothetical protein